MNSRVPFLPMACLAGAVVFSTLTGCATVDQKIALNYAPVERPLGRHSGEVAVSRTDARPYVRNDKGEWVVGSLNNVHGVHRADILADRTLGEWISDALALELKHAGYTVASASSLPATVPAGVLITDINVSLNVNKGTFSDDARQELKFNVDVFLSGVKVKTFTVASHNNSTFLSTSPEDEEKIMLQSLQDAMRQIIPDVIALIEKK